MGPPVPRSSSRRRSEVSPILKYLVAVTDHLASFAFLLGLIFGTAPLWGRWGRRAAWGGVAAGLLLGCAAFGVRLWDPKGMNLILIAFNRWLVVGIAGLAWAATVGLLLACLMRKAQGLGGPLLALLLSALTLAALTYLLPPTLQFGREFVYFGESGVSTNALLRALGFALGLTVCLLLSLSACQVGRACGGRWALAALLCSVLIFALEYGARAVAALQRLRVIPLTDAVFQIMIWRDACPNAFLFAQLALALVLVCGAVAAHRKPVGEFPNKASLRKEKARLRNCRRWAWSLLAWGSAAILIVTVLYWLDARPPAEAPLEPYALEDGIISIGLEQVSDGHLHKFSYVTPASFDVRFLIVKKPAGTAYGVGLDACEICGVAGYYERGDEEVVCRRCDVVMNKNTIGFRGGCNPIPFPYEIRESKIFIDVKELIAHERRFK